MAPSVFSPNSLAWSALPVAVLLSYLWLKRKRVEFPSDVDLSKPEDYQTQEKEIEELGETQPLLITPRKSTRSLSGVESAPINISYPPELRLTNSNDYVPDEDLDTELRRASSTNIFDRYQAVNQSVTSEQKDSAFYKANQHLDQIDQIPTAEKQILLKSQSLENVFVPSNASMTQFDTCNHSEASQPEQGDILSQSFQNGMMAHEHSHLSNKSSTEIESADTLKTSNYAAQLKEASQTAEIPEEVAQTAEIPEEVAQTADIPAENIPTVEATIPAEVGDEAYTPVEEVSSTVQSVDEVPSLVESSEEVSPITETSEEVSLPTETPEEVSSTVEISEETQTEKTEPVDPQIEDVATQTSKTEIIPNKTGAIPKAGKKKRQKFRPLPLETITGGKTQSYSRNKRRNERRRNYAQSDEFAEEVMRKTSERATANSPTSASSSSISSIAESTDSGKGCSEAASPPASRLTPTDETKNEITSFSFTIPHIHVGLLKGAQCGYINMIKRTAHVDISLKITNPTAQERKQHLCTVRGTKKGIDHALSIMKERFPKHGHDQVTFTPVEGPRPYTKPKKIPIQHTYLQLADHTSNDTVVACMEAPDHLYMHLHLSPSHNELPFYTNYMKELYSKEKDVQFLPKEVPVGSGCVALFHGNWYRAQILSTNPETNTSVIKLLDYGGVEVINNSCLRQYHCTLMGLPFQAIECYLYNVKPKGESWCSNAYRCISELTTGVLVQTHVVRYRDNIPEVIVIVPHVDSQNDICINNELVRQNLADYISIEDIPHREDEVENLPPTDNAGNSVLNVV